MASFWPTADQNPSAPEPIAEFARTPKIVFSRTLTHVEHKSRLAGYNLGAEVARVKQDSTETWGCAARRSPQAS